MKTSLAILFLLCMFSIGTSAQQKILEPGDFAEKVRTVGGELQIVSGNSVELNGRPIFKYSTGESDERGVFLTPHYSFGDTDVVLFWVCGSQPYSTGSMRLITVRRNGSATVSPQYLGTGMFPVVTRKARSLEIFFSPSVGLHGGSPYAETWTWQAGTLRQVRAKRRRS